MTDNNAPDPELQNALDRSKAKASAGMSKVTLALAAAVILVVGFIGGYVIKGTTTSDSNNGPSGNFRRGGYGMMGGYGMGEGGFRGGEGMPSGAMPSGAPQGGGSSSSSK